MITRKQWHDFWHPAEPSWLHFTLLSACCLVAGVLAIPLMQYVMLPLAKALSKPFN